LERHLNGGKENIRPENNISKNQSHPTVEMVGSEFGSFGFKENF